MRTAQQLYEGVDRPEGAVGLITYMRTDSTRISGSAADEARDMVGGGSATATCPTRRDCGAASSRRARRRPTRPSGPRPRCTPRRCMKRYLDRDQHRLYELIWLRFVAGQMKPAVYDTTTIDFDLAGGDATYLFRATGSIMEVRRLHAPLPGGPRGGRPPHPRRPRAAAELARRTELHVHGIDPPSTSRSRRPASPRRAWSRSWSAGASGGRPRTRRSSPRSRDREYVKLEQKRFSRRRSARRSPWS
jgi:DNA topoisomerase I